MKAILSWFISTSALQEGERQEFLQSGETMETGWVVILAGLDGLVLGDSMFSSQRKKQQNGVLDACLRFAGFLT